MADNDDKRDDHAGGKKTLTLKGGPAMGGLRPGLGRSSRTVVVEKRTRRVGPPGSPGASPHAPAGSAPAPRLASGPSAGSAARPPLRGNGPGIRPSVGLSQTENIARERALREAAARQVEETARAAAEEARRAEEDARRRAAREAEEQARAAEESARAVQSDTAVIEEEPAIRTVAPRPAAAPRRPAPVSRAPGRGPDLTNLPPAPPSEADGRRARTAPPSGSARPLVGAAELENARRART
ncbi:MAG TPA: hypothetical protein VHB23_16675, partial [Devosiaceae bacterium]|nr:hypothetical protein [Devosiaceae bacterium]